MAALLNFQSPSWNILLAGGGEFPPTPKLGLCRLAGIATGMPWWPVVTPARESPPLLPQPQCFPHLLPEVVTPFLLSGLSPDGGRAGGLGGRHITGGGL